MTRLIHPRRVNEPELQGIQDAVRDQLDRSARLPLLPLGKPKFVFDDYQAKHGDLVVVDPAGGALTVSLPKVTVNDLGRVIGVYNHSGLTTAITIASSDSENINGGSSVSISTARQGGLCVAVAVGEWMFIRSAA